MRFSSMAVMALAGPLARPVSGHGWVTGVRINGVFTPGSDPNWYYYPAGTAPATAGWYARNQDLGFIEPVNFGSGADLACHKSATAGTGFVRANAGDTVHISWNTWPDSHKGPIMNYIAPYNNERTAGTLRWSKISQAGIVSGTTWATDRLPGNNFTSSVTLPRNLRAGRYVLRHEIIALHSAYGDNGAQSYPQCLNFVIAGTGSVSPAASSAVLSSALYRATDPGIKFDLYKSYSQYSFPGPALWTAAN